MSAWTRLWGSPTQRWRPEGEASSPLRGPTLRNGARPGTGARILFINQYYWPDHASTAQHLADLAESLVSKGFACHVLSSRGGYRAGETPQPAREVHHGVHIHRVGATSFGRRSTLRRMTDYLSFYAQALIKTCALPRFDVVVTLTTPPIIGLIGTILQRVKGSRHVFWSMDLHPDASIALGRMAPRNPVVAALAWLSNTVYRQADRVVVLGSYMADRVFAKRVRPNRVVTIPVWSRQDEIYPIPREGHPLRAELGLADKFVAMYSGNLGLAHAFDEFLEAARQLQHRREIVFLFVGDGPRMREVRAAKQEWGLENVRDLDYFPRGRLHESLTVADVHLLSMRREMTGIVVPGKLYGVLASGRPALFVGPQHSESADTIRQAECGLTVRQGDVASLVEAIELLASDSELAQGMGARGRAAFLDEYEREHCCERWAEVIDAVVSPSRTYGAKNKPRQVLPSSAPAGNHRPS
jgi:glycosyltransferase involved in cell wall biosynthesis